MDLPPLSADRSRPPPPDRPLGPPRREAGAAPPLGAADPADAPWRDAEDGPGGGPEDGAPAPGFSVSLPPPRFRTLRTIGALVLREMAATYGRSPGGYIWAILQPLGIIAILSLAFSLLIRSPPLGTSFVFFYATGYLPFDIYSTQASKTANTLRVLRSLLNYPAVTWLDAILARFLLNLLTDIAVAAILFTGIIWALGIPVMIDMRPIIEGVLLAALGGLGIGLVNALLGGIWPIWAILWGIVTRPLFIASGVLFLYEDLPATVRDILWWNPLVHVIALVRSGFYPTYDASFVSIPYCAAVALILVMTGLLFMRSYYKLILEQ
ncbi:ABC transporter permease [Rubellimicrobium sp. CFH 75288]|uniref:ABC transporter permease n=1 Tax=Rubellimicrobium sp. CFH 75288 TaxID=2697034 RepID=UPI001411B745|nr:ABC transporter permease [Rubellimicrobium sp. CFH 75288]NAZ38187.1 ABC transporter permease [Rubellimicrobium sp. CFH 75288]